MLEQLLFWDRKPPRRVMGVWRLLILLAPLALACSVWFQRQVLAGMPVRIEIDRADAIRAAGQFLESRMVEASNFDVSVRPWKNMDLYRSLLTHKREALDKVGYWGFVKVMLREPTTRDLMQVDVDLKGNVLGYNFLPSEMPARPYSADQARKLAEAAKEERLRELPFLEFGQRDETEPQQHTTASPYRYVWPITFRDIPHLKGRLHLRILNERVVENWIGQDLDPAGRVEISSVPEWLSGAAFVAYFAGLCVFVIIRFVKRRVQKEVSLERMWLVAGIGSLLFTIVQFLGDSFAVRGDFGALPSFASLAMLSLLGMVIGLVAGMFYSACEGDLRESFPNLLTSLDALLCGRAFSRNVGRSVVLGAVAASWAFLLRNAVYVVFKPQFAGADSLNTSLDFLYSRIPAASALLSTPASALFVSLAALLCPLTVLARHCRGRNRLYLLLALSAWFAVAVTSSEPLPFVPLAIVSLVTAASVVFTFFTVDFLASVVVLIGCQLLGLAGLSQIAPIWSRHDHWAILGGAVVIGLAAWSLWKGTPVADADVRPPYARNIEERIQLQSEVAAAREAQLRLLPAAPPRLQGMSISATCVPAEQVSGDFYDFYPLGPNRTAILLSDGGGNGLATALSIALTKGYLMHKAESGAAPVEALAGAAAMLGEEIRGFTAEGLCYAIVDQHERLVRYARLGATPSLLAVGQSPAVPETIHQVGGQIIREGAIRLSPGQPLILYTNGLSKVLRHIDSHSTNRWILKRAADWSHTADHLIEHITALVFRKGTARHLNEDVTLIAITADQERAETAERVA